MTFHILGTAEMQERIAEGDARARGGNLTQEDFTAAIVAWTKTKRQERDATDALTQDEIGKMKAFDRVDAFRKSLILNMSMYYQANPQADVAPGVLLLITFMADNERGLSQLSHDTMAAILYRHRTTIAAAMVRLKKAGLVDSDKGRAGAYPIIPRVLTAQYNHIVWLTTALKPVLTSQQVGEGACADKPTGNLCRQANRLNEPVLEPQQVQNQPVPTSQHNFTKDLSLTQSLEESHHSLSDLQDCNPDRASAEGPVRTNDVEGMNGHAIANAAAKAAKPKTTRQKKAKPSGGRPNYSESFTAFWLAYPRHSNMSKANAFVRWEALDDEDRHWATAAAEAYRVQQQRKAQQEGLSAEDIASKTKHAERFLKDRRFEAYREHIESKQAAEKCTPTGDACISQEPSVQSATRFNEGSTKVAVVKSIWIDGTTANRILDAVGGATLAQVKDSLFEADRQPEAMFVQSSAFATNVRATVASSKIVDWCIDWLNVSAQFSDTGSERQC
jgi:hypothetical protein